MTAPGPAQEDEAPEVGGRGLRQLGSGAFSPDDPNRFQPLLEQLLVHDYFMVVADFARYAAAQRAVDEVFRDPETWWRRAILNTAKVGWFSSDRTIRDYASEIWDALPPRP